VGIKHAEDKGRASEFTRAHRFSLLQEPAGGKAAATVLGAIPQGTTDRWESRPVKPGGCYQQLSVPGRPLPPCYSP